MCIMHCRKYHLHNCNKDFHLHNDNKNCHLHICCRNMSPAYVLQKPNYITETETVTWIIVRERSTNIPVTESNIWNLSKCNRRCHLHSCHRYIDQWHSYSRNCHLQKWPQKLSLAEKVPVWDSFIYNKEIKQMSKR